MDALYLIRSLTMPGLRTPGNAELTMASLELMDAFFSIHADFYRYVTGRLIERAASPDAFRFFRRLPLQNQRSPPHAVQLAFDPSFFPVCKCFHIFKNPPIPELHSNILGVCPGQLRPHHRQREMEFIVSSPSSRVPT